MRFNRLFSVTICLWMTIAGCQMVPGHWRPGWNNPWPADKPVPDTAASWKLDKAGTGDGRFVALAISGGGSRAANFGAAVMLELQQRGLLEQVDVISGVSGGALPAVYYGLGAKAGPFTASALREALGYDFQSSWIRRWFLPQNIFGYWLSDFTRSDIMVQVFNNELYHNATFADLRLHPKILLNATVHNDHTRFTFTDDRFALLRSVLAQYRVANAVNASSAFPGAFQDVTLQWLYGPAALRASLRRRPHRQSGYSGPRRVRKPQHSGDDARSSLPQRLSDHRDRRDPVKRASGTQYERVQSGVRGLFHRHERTRCDGCHADGSAPLPPHAHGNSDGRQDKQLRGRLPVNDLHQCNCEVLHLSLRHLLYGDDSEETMQLAEQVTEIKTKFWIGDEEQDALYRAANVIMKELDAQHLFSDESLKPQCGASEH